MRQGELPSVDDLAALVRARGRDQPPGTRLRLAIELGRELSDTGDELIERFVGEARAAALTWTEIGQLFGTSKQAAQKRYGAAAADPSRLPGAAAPTAREVLDLAGRQARELGHNFVGTEHALLVLLAGRPEDVAAQVLAGLGVTRDGVLAQLGPLIDPRPYDRLCVMPRFKQALEHAGRIADELGHPFASTEHVLAGIVAVPDAMAVRILDCLGVSADDVRAALAARLGVDSARLVVTRRRRRRLLAKTSSR
jgi:hypothetical protein